jgi:hypothetical protein
MNREKVANYIETVKKTSRSPLSAWKNLETFFRAAHGKPLLPFPGLYYSFPAVIVYPGNFFRHADP